MARVTFRGRGSLQHVASSDALGDQLERIARPILLVAREDRNEYYVSTLEMRRFISRGRKGRVSIQVGAAPVVGARVEAARGTLQKAVGRAGL